MAASPKRRPATRRPSLGPWQALAALDARLSNALFRRGASAPRALWKAFELGGDGLVWLALAVGCAVASSTPPPTRNAWANFLAAWAVDLLLVGMIKGAVRRSRPVYNVLADHTVVVAVDAFSFPSGHSSRVSFVALFAAVLFRHSHPGLCVAVAAWALATALSRAAMGRHYLSDVLAGLALGAVTIAIVTLGTYSRAGLVVSQQQSEAAYAFAQQVWRWLKAGASGMLAV